MDIDRVTIDIYDKYGKKLITGIKPVNQPIRHCRFLKTIESHENYTRIWNKKGMILIPGLIILNKIRIVWQYFNNYDTY